MRTGVPDLDDAEELFSADIDGMLRSVALAGAQVRSVAEAVREGTLEPLAQLRPRSVVVVYGGAAVAARAAALVVAAVAGRIDVPLVTGPSLPGWIGPLDVVVVVGDDAGDIALADAAARGLRRRAEVVVVAPIAGPLQDALGGNGIDLSPRIDVQPVLRLAGYVAALLAVCSALTAVRFVPAPPDLDDVADALDAEASAGHPAQPSFHNRAKSLAMRIQGRPTAWTGDSPAAVVLATHAAAGLAGIAGVVSAATDLADAAALSALAGLRGGSSAADSIFYDPDIDGPAAEIAPRVQVISTAAREWRTRRRVAGLGDVDLLVGDDTEATGGRGPAGPETVGWGSMAEDAADGPADLMSFLLVVLRVEMAAVYLRLVGNKV